MRNVIFDLDGTLVDSIPGIQWSVDAALAACAMPPRTCSLRPLIGPPIREILSALTAAKEPVLLDGLVSAFRSAYDSEGWRKTTCQPGARNALENLFAAGCRMWVVTNKPGRASREILRELGMMSFFLDVVSPDSRTPPFNSKAGMLVNLLECCALNRAATIMVGDTLEDCRAAEEAGIACAFVPHGYGRPDCAIPPGCRAISGWDDLFEWCRIYDAMSADPSQPNHKLETGEYR
jgi:phosphoglycolate phosphatase